MIGTVIASGWRPATTQRLQVVRPPLAAATAPPLRVTLPNVAEVPRFTLTDETGRPFENGALKDRVWIADFIFTSCAGSCPQITQKMRLLQKRLPEKIQFVSISVDPTRDTPPVLAEYARQAGAQAGRWHFLTGSPSMIGSLVQEGFHLSVAEGGGPQEPVIHSIRLVLVDAEGRIRGYYDSTDLKSVEQLIRDALQLVH